MALKQKLGLDIGDFRQGITDAKGLSTTAAEFFAKQWAKSQLKNIINTHEFKTGVDGATKYLIDQFQKVKPTIQSLTQSAVKEGTEASIKTASILASPALKGGFQALSAVGIPAVMGLTAALGPLAIAAGVTIESVKLMDDAFKSAMADLARMVELSDKSKNLGLSASFLQQFTFDSKKLQVSADDLEGALKIAFDATKEISPIDVSKFDVADERITETEKLLRVYNETVAKSAGTSLQGLTLFRDATTQQDKVMAVLTSMKELDAIGHELESMKLGESMFGSAFVQNIRQGKTSAESILDSMNKARDADAGIFSDAMVERAKSVDTEMKLASAHLSTEMQPAFTSLETSILDIEESWSKVVELIAEAVALSNKIPWNLIGESLKLAVDPFGYIAAKIGETVGKATGFITPPAGPNMTKYLEGGDDAPPKPSRGPGPAPKLKPKATSGSEADPLLSAENSVEKRTAAQLAEVAAIDLGTAARTKATVAARLETVAKQANAKAGLDGTKVSDEQAAAIDKVATAAGNAAAKIEAAHSPMATFIRESADLDKQLNQFGADLLNGLTNGLADALTGVKSLKDAFADLINQVLNDLAKIAIRKLLVAPLASAFGLADGGEVSSVAAFNAGSHLYADGGPVRGPGTSRSDSIPAMLSDGEFVVNASSTAKHRKLLHAINSGKLPGFADGGPVGGSGSNSIGGGSSSAPTIHAPITVNVTASGGTKMQNADLAAQVGASVRDAVDARFSQNLRQAMRPGGVLSSARR